MVLTIAILSSCTKEEDVLLQNEELIEKWKLIVQYWDPRDGSDDYQPIVSEGII
ncbi:hypothetical protein [Aureibaculum luteum]|uniref:hypothetical protein n=1 Tax=Aureibaculum luteum TaxID=1548456 RepID=UPI0013006C16|nr:hypothetical protein [Aureibaculum luteum]